jgi:hypothetical protein
MGVMFPELENGNEPEFENIIENLLSLLQGGDASAAVVGFGEREPRRP